MGQNPPYGGLYPNYVTKARGHEKWGMIDECPAQILIEHVVDWTTPGTMKIVGEISGRWPKFWDYYSDRRISGQPVPNPLFQWGQ
jgi:hypothetical protein